MKSVTHIQGESPFPWRYMVVNGSQVVVVDAANMEVPLFSVVDLAVQATHDALAKQAAAQHSG